MDEYKQIRERILEKLEDLTEKIQENTPCPENDQDYGLLAGIDDRLEECLNSWYY